MFAHFEGTIRRSGRRKEERGIGADSDTTLLPSTSQELRPLHFVLMFNQWE